MRPSQLSSMPLLQISIELQHVPLWQSMLVPHEVPFATSVPVSVHVGVPEQLSVPTWHGLAGVHGLPWVQLVHAPLTHTSLVPHTVPLGAGSPVSMQTGAPVEQSVIPASHGLPVGVQAAFCVHALHAPSSQTMFVPHEVPGASGTRVSVQVCVPVAQEVEPTSQGLAGVHERPAVHPTHEP